MRKTEDERAQAKSAFLSGLLELTMAKSKDGPFFMGKEFGMVICYFIETISDLKLNW